MNYTEAKEHVGTTQIVGTSGGRYRRAVFTQVDDEVHIRLFQTTILVFHRDGSFTIDTGGYNTMSTREALNALLPRPLWVGTHQRVLYLHGAGDQVAVTDGMRVRAGRVIATGRPVPLDMTLRRPPRGPSRKIIYCIDRDTGLVVSKLGSDYAWPVLDFAGMSPADGFQTHYNLQLLQGDFDWELGIVAATHVSPDLRLAHQAFWIEQRRQARGDLTASSSAS